MNDMELYTSGGKVILIEGVIGKGGEGAVCGTGDKNLAAKIYKKPPDALKAEKLKAMARVKNEKLLAISAWPVDTLHSVKNGPVVGILMPRIYRHKEIHKLYNPKSRIVEYPSAGWDFLIHAAANLARAVSTVHSQGHVVGDINHGNIVVSSSGIAVLIDCDSFQVEVNGVKYPCNVGVPIYQPPEMQNIKTFTGVERTKNHDCFGLAVLIFQLLFMGRHPFSEKYAGKGDMPLHRAIKEGRFAYSKALKYKKPDGTLSLDELPEDLACLFEDAFLKPNRPTADMWVTELEKLLKQLKQCPSNPSHRFYNKLTNCPWCRIEKMTGALLFNPAAGNVIGNIDIDEIWKDIEKVPALRRPALPDWMSLKMRPSKPFYEYMVKKRIIKIISAAAFILGFLGFFVINASIVGIVGIFASAAAAALGFKPASRDMMEKVKLHYDSMLEKFNNCIKPWKNDDSEKQLQNKKGELEKLYESYRELEAAREAKLKDVQENRRKYQLERFLKRYSIMDIKGISPGLRALLQTYGIKSAADIKNTIVSIKDLKPGTFDMLIKWRKSIESRFVFDPGRGIDREIMDRIEKEFLAEKNKIASALLKGRDEIIKLYDDTVKMRKEMLNEIEKCGRELSKARENLKAIGYKP